MEQKNDRGFKIIAIIALVVAVAGLSIAYAGYTSTLTINGTATVSSAWKIVWDDLDDGTATGYASTTGKTLAIDSTDQAISGFIGTLKAPGDTIKYTWNVENQGDINAELTGLSLGSLSCAPATTAGSTTEEATSLCSKLSVTFTYGGTTVTTGTTGLATALDSKATKPVTMTITYNAGDGVELSGDVAVTLSTTSFTYAQTSA